MAKYNIVPALVSIVCSSDYLFRLVAGQRKGEFKLLLVCSHHYN